MTFRVEITAEAERELDSILSWLISEHAGDAGFHWFATLEEAVATLAKFPRRCPLAPESRLFSFEVRQLLHGKRPHVYRILFTITDQTVYVLHVRHGRRQLVRQ
jgi:plasmid stabilization system protein ParE